MRARLIEYKFERNVDPKQSMQTGMKEEVKQFMRSINKEKLGYEYALIFASTRNRLDLVKWLIDPNGGDANKYINNDAPIRTAAIEGNEKIVEYLLQFYRTNEILGIIRYCKNEKERTEKRLKETSNKQDRTFFMKQINQLKRAIKIIEIYFKEKISK